MAECVKTFSNASIGVNDSEQIFIGGRSEPMQVSNPVKSADHKIWRGSRWSIAAAVDDRGSRDLFEREAAAGGALARFYGLLIQSFLVSPPSRSERCAVVGKSGFNLLCQQWGGYTRDCVSYIV